SQGDASIESCRYECVPERVRPDGLADTGAASHPSDNPGGTVPVQPPAIGGQEDRPRTALNAGPVDRPPRARRQRGGHGLAAFGTKGQRRVATFGADRLDAGAGGLRTRSPFKANRQMSACSAAPPSPAATRRPPSSLRSSPAARDS